MGILPAQLFSKWGFELQGAEPTPDQTAFGLFFSGLCAGGEFFISSTSPTDFDLALNPFTTAPTGGGDFATFTDFS